MYREKHKTNTTMKNDIIRIGRYRLRSINVQYFTWFQKTYGNPYFAMIVTVNKGYPSEQTFVVPMQYGYPAPYYVMDAVIKQYNISDPDRRKRNNPSDYGVCIYQYATQVKYRQIVKIK